MKKLRKVELIRARCHAQGLFGDYPSRRIQELLDRAWYVTNKYSVNSRLTYNFKQPMNAIRRKAVELVLVKQRVSMSYSNFSLIYLLEDNNLEDKNVKKLIGKDGHISEEDLRSKLQTRSISQFVNPYLNSFQLIIVKREGKKEYWHPSYFFRHLANQELIDVPDDILKKIAMKLLQCYPYLSVDQISLLSGIQKFDLGKPLHHLLTEGKIIRVQTENLGEYFCLSETEVPQQRSWYPSFVLDARDPFIVILKKELNLEKNQYYFFSDGSIQCGFDLKRRENSYLVTNFHGNELTTLMQDELMEGILLWGRTQYIELKYDQKHSPQGKVAHRFVDILMKRGYLLESSSLILAPVNNKRGKLRLNECFRRILSRNYTSIEEYIDSVIQVESLESIRIRFNVPFVDVSQYSQIYGVGGRFALVSLKNVPLILCTEAKEYTPSLLTDKILDIIKEEIMISTGDILTNFPHSHEKAVNGLRYLENHHKIQRVPSTANDIDSQVWQLLSIPEVDIQYSRSEILKLLLQNAPPLTTLQITRYLGWTLPQLKNVLHELLEKGEVQEGYFLQDVEDVQYYIPSEFTDIEDKKDFISFYPAGEPFALILPELIIKHPEIRPIKALSPHQEVFFILDNYEPAGYFVLSDAKDHFELKLYLIDEYLNSILPVLEIINPYVQSRYLKNGRLISINNQPLSAFEKLHFAIELLGFKI